MVIYLGSIGALGSVIGYLYYHSEKYKLVENLHMQMRYKARDINSKLEYYHNLESEEFTFYEEGYGIALYDKNKALIASTFDDKIDFSQLFYHKGLDYYLVESIIKEYLNVKYIVIKKTLPIEKLDQILEQIWIVALFGFVFLLFIALLLSKIMLYPLRQAIQTLKQFIKDTAHEMNTPISTILMSQEHMPKENLSPKQLRALDRIEIATKTLSQLYNDLTFISFHTHINYEDTKINLKDIIEERIRYMETMIQFKKIEIECHMIPKEILMDRRKVVLLIDNLLSNAIKFSRQGGYIRIDLCSEQLSIQDNGIGIKEDEKKKIFKRFESTSTQTGGFGLGLDIVSQICREYGIKIEVDSVFSKGSTFTLIFPKQSHK